MSFLGKEIRMKRLFNKEPGKTLIIFYIKVQNFYKP
jgi:hypothetical protein